MVSRHMKTWTGLLAFAAGLLWLNLFAPLSDALDKVLSGMATAIMLAYVCSHWWEGRRERQANQSSNAAISSSDQT